MTFTTFAEQYRVGTHARAVLREAQDMIARIEDWDEMTHAEKVAEYALGSASRFREVPGFEPRWCADCYCEQFFDYRDDPEGACGVCGAWDGHLTIQTKSKETK